MKKEKGFTLIELLAVIVILAIIALIAVPQVLKILNKARLSAAEDSVYGIVKASESYVTNFMLKNNGNIPSEDLVFNCSSDGCKLKNTLEGYNLTNLDVLDFKGTTPTSGKITVKNGGKEIITENLKVNGFTCKYENEKVSCSKSGNSTIVVCENLDDEGNCITSTTYSSGDSIKLANYNWHVISDDGKNVTLLMDVGENGTLKLPEDPKGNLNEGKMKHCNDDSDTSTDCDFNGSYYVYSWDKSLIREYLNNTLYSELQTKISNIVTNKICADASRSDAITTYGGYLKSEIENISGANCTNGYVTDYVRLISTSEYYNLSPNYTTEDLNYPNISNINRLKGTSDYANWLYSSSIEAWWTMGAWSDSISNRIMYAHGIGISGNLYTNEGDISYGIRPVITISKTTLS